MIHLFPLVAAMLPAPAIEIEFIGIDYNDVASRQMRVPVSDSVRALTWDRMRARPKQAATVRLACLVWKLGKVGNCVEASLVPAGQTKVDWERLRDADSAAFKAATPLERSLRVTAENRASAAIMPENDGAKLNQVMVRFFTETISPADARAPYSPSPQPPLRMSEVTLERPMDGSLIRDLFPVTAMRKMAEARVSLRCRVQQSGRLLCRDPGTISADQAGWGSDRDVITDDFQIASYQVASTLIVRPKARNGEPTVGRDLQLGIAWVMPPQR
jgi:hypothetical protein